MNAKTMKVLVMVLMLTVGAAQAAVARTTGVTPDYISPGIGTLIVAWLSQWR